MEGNVIKIKFMFIIFFIIVFLVGDIAVYAQTKMDSNQEQYKKEIDNRTKDADKAEILEIVAGDNNTYKVLNPDKEDNTVIFWKCADNLENIIVNNEIEYNGRKFKVKYVYEKAFSNSKTGKNIIIDSGVLGFCDSTGNYSEILNGAFINQIKLKSIDFGSTKFVFGERCFKNCKAITDIKIPKNMNFIENNCFDTCLSLKSINLNGITEFKGHNNFINCSKLQNIGEFNDEILELPARAFANCSNLKINSLKNITKLGNECFKYCRLLDGKIFTCVEEIGENCFEGCNFSEVYLEKAKKVGYNAFGDMGTLTKIRFGNSTIPILGKNIVGGSNVSEWVYPLDYKTQPDYLEFLRNLRIAQVMWYSNYGNKEREIEFTQDVKLDRLSEPSILRDGYKIEGWYKEPECINKINMIADLGKISGSDLVIKDPKLYAKWIAKDQTTQEEKKDPSNTEKPTTQEEKKDPSDTEKPTTQEEKKNPNNIEDPITKEETKDINCSKENDEKNVKYENHNSSRRLYDLRNSKNDINNFIIKIEGENKEVNIQESDKLFLENELIKNIFMSSTQTNNVEIKCFNWSFIDKVNSNIEVIKSGTLNKINKNNKCIGICLNSNDCFNNNTIIKMNIKNIIKPSKLYSYSEELGKFILIDDNLQINNDNIDFKTTNKKRYLITQFDLNEDILAVQGWNKVLPQQSNALLSKDNIELSWVYIQGQELSKGWVKDIQNNNWYFMNDNGIMETEWLIDKDNKRYYLNTISDGSKGAMKIGWNKIHNEWYYFQKDGALAVNTNIDGYAVGYDGKLI